MKLRKEFATQKEFYQYLVKNKRELIEFKFASRKFTQPFSVTGEIPVVKSLSTSYADDVSTGKITRTIIANTYNWMDSQKDVLINGVFSRSISENKDRIWHLHDHIYEIAAKVGRPKSIYEKSVDWKDLGVNIEGSTMALFVDSEIYKQWNPIIFDQYLKGEIDQHSVGMMYKLIDLAINDQDQKEEYAAFNKYIDRIGNKEEVMKDGYFWAVREGMLKEFSCVLEGSNELTPTVENESKSKAEPEIEIKHREYTFYERLAEEMGR